MGDDVLDRFKKRLKGPINQIFSPSTVVEVHGASDEALDIESLVEEIKRDREKERCHEARRTLAQRAYDAPVIPPPSHMSLRLAEASNAMEVLGAASEETTAKLNTLHAQVEDVSSPIDKKEFLQALRRLRRLTDETIEMAPGVHEHSIDLVIEMLEGRLK